jgi:hypothetical protein
MMFMKILREKVFRRSASGLVMFMLLQPFVSNCSICAAEDQSASGAESFSRQYTGLTKKILLSSIELERFSLNFRLENDRVSRLRQLRYFLGQEAAASCGLAFEIAGDYQFGKGRRHPLKVSRPALHDALAAAMTGSIIGGSSSCLELGANLWHEWQSCRRGYDPRSARAFVVSKLKQIDELLAQREALVAAHSDDPAHERAVVEGQILRAMRSAFINEFSQFNAHIKGTFAFQNLFLLANASYNAVGAIGAGAAYRGVKQPKYNGPANLLFIVSGAMAAASPILSSVASKVVRQEAAASLAKTLNEKPAFDPAAFSLTCKQLESLVPEAGGRLIPSLPATQRLALYTQADDLFARQLRSEVRTFRWLDRIALETSLLGPPIGSLLMSQGIFGTTGYYRYSTRPRKQLSMFYRGAVVGTVGASLNVVGNAGWLLTVLSYEHHLLKGKRMPAQLINARLEHLSELEKTVSAL